MAHAIGRVVIGFVLGFALAQAGSWLGARSAMSIFDPVTFSGWPPPRFILIACVETIVAAIAFSIALVVSSKLRPIPSSVGVVLVASALGAVASIVTVGPYALVPSIVAGEMQLLVYLFAAMIVGAIFGGLLAAIFGKEKQI